MFEFIRNRIHRARRLRWHSWSALPMIDPDGKTYTYCRICGYRKEGFHA